MTPKYQTCCVCHQEIHNQPGVEFFILPDGRIVCSSQSCMNAVETPQLDFVTAYLVKNKVPLTQKNWIEFMTLGEKSRLDQLEAEELSGLPENFELWPENDFQVN